ncbi:Crp/Fnr family transcriptional regulator [Thiosulfatihalobacter marinus]|uniref:Crp/Fnr family transcriptional regulator n=1 Tax=Thiosulfatihalobacter marinus TaxID=2792481 RepID=UPI0018D66BEC|nr:Crp/Fnr family transcriptional regulator [Thiosulfatihalobacter marinus]
MTSIDSEIVAKCRLLGALTPEVRDCLLSRARRRNMARGELLGLQGEPAGTLKIVASGWVKLFRVSEDGHEAVVNTLGNGESFDEVSALLGGVSASSAEAVTDAELLLLNLTDICFCANARAEISAAVLSAAQLHMDAMTAQIEALKVKTATQRLGEFLLKLSDETGDAHNVALPFGKVVLAGMLGMKPESLSRAFARLKRAGVRSAMREIEIDDIAALRDWTGAQGGR